MVICAQCCKPIQTREEFHILKRVLRPPRPLHVSCVYETGGSGTHVSAAKLFAAMYGSAAVVFGGLVMYLLPDALRRMQAKQLVFLAVLTLTAIYNLVLAIYAVWLMQEAKSLPN